MARIHIVNKWGVRDDEERQLINLTKLMVHSLFYFSLMGKNGALKKTDADLPPQAK